MVFKSLLYNFLVSKSELFTSYARGPSLCPQIFPDLQEIMYEVQARNMKQNEIILESFRKAVYSYRTLVAKSQGILTSEWSDMRPYFLAISTSSAFTAAQVTPSLEMRGGQIILVIQIVVVLLRY